MSERPGRDLVCTYRLQLTPELDFRAALELVPYLRELGVSHLYLSPSLQAAPGSTHGYDVVDPTRISDDLGGEEALRELCSAGLGVVLDVVPNHMGIADGANRFWEAGGAERDRVFDVDPETGFARRFFDIDTLIGVRQEDPDVFELTHAKPLELVRDGLVDGLRIDHPDGMADPAGYLRRLAEHGVQRVWVEKILHVGEPLREDWPVSGTVGYEFLDDVCALYVDPAGEHVLSALWAELSGDDRAFEALALEAQLEQAEGTFEREVEWLVRLSGGRFEAHVLAEALARLPVYRTYVEPWSGRVAAEDRRAVGEAELPRELEQVLLLEDRSEQLDDFVTRFQQTSSPVTAKGIEDTAFYRYHRLVALNEVGGDPGRFGLSVADFHAAQVRRAAEWPEGMLSTQTHDTKRSGDARARVGALAGMAPAWEAFVRAQVEDDGLPADEQLLALQAIVAAQPLTRERLDGYLEKALREGKRTTNWIDPDLEHERAVQEWAWERAQDPAVVAFCAEVAVEGERAALGQWLLKLTSPGVSDIYNGDELWTFSLVDPDNRRPVDWGERRRVLDAVLAGEAPTRETVKLHLTQRTLALKARRFEAAFAAGAAYRPLAAGEGVCAYARGTDVLVVAPLRDWADAELEVPEDLRGTWRCALTDREVQLDGASALVAELLAEPYGVALLERA